MCFLVNAGSTVLSHHFRGKLLEKIKRAVEVMAVDPGGQVARAHAFPAPAHFKRDACSLAPEAALVRSGERDVRPSVGDC